MTRQARCHTRTVAPNAMFGLPSARCRWYGFPRSPGMVLEDRKTEN